eukprot:TRINITY_DN3298_c0_g2_i2.p1 TRINITY_DN3298_c0_g2~~TRINITY_DN3298_c0_g2_i2.p1  ORF type:complete len:635 (-),score=148.98 TRINITY_DN3298_c0_g2_i2:19-1923(-)
MQHRACGRWRIKYVALTALWVLAVIFLFAAWMILLVLDLTVGDVLEARGILRSVCIMTAIAGCLFLLFRSTIAFINWVLRLRLLLGALRMVFALTLLAWGIIMFTSFQHLTFGELEWDCADDDGDQIEIAPAPSNSTTVVAETEDTSDDDDNIFSDVCISWRWFFLCALLTGACWTVLNIIEEVIFYKTGIRLDQEELRISAVREFALAVVGRHARQHRAIPKRNDANNRLFDLYLRVYSLRQDELLDALDRATQERGAFRDARKRRDRTGLKEELRDQATSIFNVMDKEEKGYLTVEDIERICPEHATGIFLVFDMNYTGSVSFEEFVVAIGNIYFGRARVWDSFNDRTKIVSLLRIYVGIGFWGLMMVLWIVLSRVSVSAVLLPSASIVLGLSFAFGSLVQTIIESFVLMLFVRPFDVGDKIQFTLDGSSYFVHELGLFRCEFWSVDNRKVYISNKRILDSDIINLRRSRAFTQYKHFHVGHDTPGSMLLELKNRIDDYLEDSDTFLAEECCVSVIRIENTNRIVVEVWLEMVYIPWAAYVEWSNAMTEFMVFVQKTCKALGIRYETPPQRFISMDYDKYRKQASSRRVLSRRATGMVTTDFGTGVSERTMNAMDEVPPGVDLDLRGADTHE